MIKKLIKKFKNRKQRIFCYCPRCRNELVSSDSFVEDRDGIVKYKCSQCGNVTFWDFIHFPVPYLRACADCRHMSIDCMGFECCSKDCYPDTQILFEPKRPHCEYCDEAKPLIIGKTNDQGIAIHYPNKLNAYGYDVNGSGHNGLSVEINYCPMCGRQLKKEKE